MYDVIIVGGGPAGSTLARLIGKKLSVLLLDKRSFETGRTSVCHKCCGGLIAPDAQLMLAKFGLGIPKSVILSPQLFAVRTLDLDNSLERYYQRHYINVDREEFDKWLQSIIPADVGIVNGAVFKSFAAEYDGVRVKFHHAGKDYEEKARILIGADGAFSRVRRLGFNRCAAPRLYISIQEWFETQQNLDYYGAIFDSEVTDFYSWTIPKDKYLIVGSALVPDNKANDRFNLLKYKLAGYGFDLKKCITREGSYLLRPMKLEQICTGDDRIALVGEAAGFISPSSAEGLSYAFRSSLALAKALLADFDGYHAVYSKNLGSLKQNIMLKNLKSPAMYNNFLRKVIMKTGLLSIELEGMEDK